MRAPSLAALAAAVVLAGCTTTTAAARYDHPYVWQRAHDTGYRDGHVHGERDGRAGRSFGYAHAGDYARANRGYHPSDGRRGDYQARYRNGYAAGYTDGYALYSRARGGSRPRVIGPPAGGWPSRATDPAFERGYTDGYDKGFDDGRDRDRFDVLRHKWYRSGDRGYGGWYGSKARYQDLYRDGFRGGYERGYRDGAGGGPRWRAGGFLDFRWRW